MFLKERCPKCRGKLYIEFDGHYSIDIECFQCGCIYRAKQCLLCNSAVNKKDCLNCSVLVKRK